MGDLPAAQVLLATAKDTTKIDCLLRLSYTMNFGANTKKEYDTAAAFARKAYVVERTIPSASEEDHGASVHGAW
jgi:hypothetical protein